MIYMCKYSKCICHLCDITGNNAKVAKCPLAISVEKFFKKLAINRQINHGRNLKIIKKSLNKLKSNLNYPKGKE